MYQPYQPYQPYQQQCQPDFQQRMLMHQQQQTLLAQQQYYDAMRQQANLNGYAPDFAVGYDPYGAQQQALMMAYLAATMF